MSKRLGLFLCVNFVSLLVYAQWSQKDSLNLRRILNTDGEIKLNPNAVKEIDFGTFIGEQMMIDEKPALKFDVTLPKVFPDKAELKLSLRPYTANTKYNYDPIYQKKIDLKDRSMKVFTVYSNWAKTPFDPGIRNSVEEIEATGMRYNPLANRVNNVAVGGWGPADGGGAFSGDFMAPFTKDFWDKNGRKRRARTLEVLQNYGDSITTHIKEGIRKAVVH